MIDNVMYNAICEKLGFKIEDYEKHFNPIPEDIYEDMPCENPFNKLNDEEFNWVSKFLGWEKDQYHGKMTKELEELYDLYDKKFGDYPDCYEDFYYEENDYDDYVNDIKML